MKLAEAFLWPGAKACEYFGVGPEGEAGLLRWLVNTIVYLVASLIVAGSLLHDDTPAHPCQPRAD